MTTLQQNRTVSVMTMAVRLIAVQLACLGLWSLAGGRVEFTRGEHPTAPAVTTGHRHPGKALGQSSPGHG